MKTINKLIVAIAIIAGTFTSCEKEKEVVPTIKVTLQIQGGDMHSAMTVFHGSEQTEMHGRNRYLVLQLPAGENIAVQNRVGSSQLQVTVNGVQHPVVRLEGDNRIEFQVK